MKTKTNIKFAFSKTENLFVKKQEIKLSFDKNGGKITIPVYISKNTDLLTGRRGLDK